MKTKFQILYCLLFVGITSHVYAVEIYDPWNLVPEETKKTCASVENLSPPSQDLPDPATQKELKKGCDAVSLYYGLYEDVNYVKARQCAFQEHSWGNLVLAMIYANGKGVQRNFDLAIKYACSEDSAPAEIEERVKHLQQLKQAKNTQEEFDMCDDITSGSMMGHCAAIQQGLEDKKQNKDLAELTSKWTPSQQKNYHKLLEASDAYFQKHVENEVDQSGTARAAIMIEEESNLKKQLIKMLQDSNQCKIANFTPQQFQEADTQLNILYKKVLKNKYFTFSGITDEGIRNTQRAWIKYLDAWVEFGHEKCPDINGDSWRTVITKERLKQLEDLNGMAGFSDEN